MVRSGLISFAVLVALVLPSADRGAWAQPRTDSGPTGELPLTVPDEQWHPLREQLDPELQRQLEAALNSRRSWSSLIRKKKFAVGLVDLTDPANPRFARVNGNTQLYAASLAKIAILLAAYQAIDDGRLQLTPEVDADLNEMIRTSSNPAATRMIDRLGLDAIEDTVTDPRYRLFDAERGGLWVGKRYGKGGRRNGDPLMNMSHAATVTQTCRFYYLLATGRVIDHERSRQMLEVLSDPGLHHKFVHALDERAPRARLFRKSGTWRNHHADSAIVWGDQWRRYIVAALIESEDGEEILRELIPVVEGVLRPASR